jgi:hypothetical protein
MSQNIIIDTPLVFDRPVEKIYFVIRSECTDPEMDHWCDWNTNKVSKYKVIFEQDVKYVKTENKPI